MKILPLIASALLLSILIACGNNAKSNANIATSPTHPKTLVLYFSNTGTTKEVAEEIHRLKESDIAEIIPSQPYSQVYDETIARWKEENDKDIFPQLRPLDVNIAEYDTIFMGFPIWGGTFANPIKTLIKDNDFSGKIIVTFATFGSGGLVSATEKLKEILPGVNIVKGYGVRNERISDAPKEINRFLIEKGYIPGKILHYRAYSPQSPVTKNEIDIFNAACGDYKFPLGTPISYGKRITPDGTDYKFKVSATTPDGKNTDGTVYVTLPNDENIRPFFTSAER